MSGKKVKNSSEKLCELVVKGMKEKKASDITVMDLQGIDNAVASFFVICSGNSDTQVDAIADSIDEEVSKNLNENPFNVEGKNNREWVLIDYVDVVAHVFKKSSREYYQLEGLWGDAKITFLNKEENQ